MKVLFWIGLFTLLIPNSFAFDCGSLDNIVACEQLSGCFWINGTGCSGSFISSCNPPQCYFVDPSDGNDSQDGSSQTPYRTLSTAFQKLQGQNGDVIIINHIPNQKVELLSYVMISSMITVRFVKF